jgi:hypothetical protein
LGEGVNANPWSRSSWLVEVALSARRIYQDFVEQTGFTDSYQSRKTPLTFKTGSAVSSGLAGSAKVPSGSRATSKAYCKATVYGAYDHIGGPKLVHSACWAHARRKFFDAVKLNPKDMTSIQVVAQIDELFGIDAEARHNA